MCTETLTSTPKREERRRVRVLASGRTSAPASLPWMRAGHPASSWASRPNTPSGENKGNKKKNRKLNKEISQTSDCCIKFFFLLLFNVLVQSMISKNKNIAMFLFKVRLSWGDIIILIIIINTYITKSIRYGYRGTSARCELALILECVQSVVGVIIQARACGKNQSSRKHPCYFFVVKKLGRKPDLRSSIVSTMFCSFWE